MNRAERAEVRTIAGLAALNLLVLAFAPPLLGWWLGVRLAVGVFLLLMVAAMVVAVRRHRRENGGW